MSRRQAMISVKRLIETGIISIDQAPYKANTFTVNMELIKKQTSEINSLVKPLHHQNHKTSEINSPPSEIISPVLVKSLHPNHTHYNHTKEPKKTTGTFEQFIENIKVEYPDIDVGLEVRKFNDYNQDTKRKIRSPRLALRNWLTKAREIKLRVNGDGTIKRSPRPVPKNYEYRQPNEY